MTTPKASTAHPLGAAAGSDADQWAWEAFAGAHPHEAHALDAERFWNYFHSRCPNVTRERMVAFLAETDEHPNAEVSGGRPRPFAAPTGSHSESP
jgi:hypothetical protein